MRIKSYLFLIVGASLLTFTYATAATPASLKLCLNSASGALTSRTKCKKNETALSLATLMGKITEQQTSSDTPFTVSVSDGFSADVTIPAATQVPNGFGGFMTFNGVKNLTATCASGVVFAASCQSASLTNLTAALATAADGKSAQCSWSNSALQARVGRFYVRVVCADL